MGGAVIFDLDGTLADTGADLVAAVNAALAGAGYRAVLDPRRDGAAAMQGGGRAMLRLAARRLERPEIVRSEDQLYQELIRAYGANLSRSTRLYPGCAAALAALARTGLPLAVCTNKPQALARPLLRRLGLAPLFRAIVGADTLAQRKPHPAPLVHAARLCGADVKQSVLVGDSGTDRETARAAGAASLLVTFGPIGHRVAGLRPEALLHHYAELGDVLRQLGVQGARA